MGTKRPTIGFFALMTESRRSTFAGSRTSSERREMSRPRKRTCVGCPLDKVELPSSSTGRQQRLTIVDVADWLSVVTAGLASSQVDEHQSFAEWRRDRQPEDESHRHVDDAKDDGHDPDQDAPRARRARVGSHLHGAPVATDGDRHEDEEDAG